MLFLLPCLDLMLYALSENRDAHHEHYLIVTAG